MGFVVKKAGVVTTVQDKGRFGYQGSGFSTNGVMDHRAFTIANLLVENDPDAPVVEFALAGPTVRFTTNTCIAITGGDFSPTLDGEPVPLYTAIMVHRGSILRFKASKTGCYGYLAIAGGSVRVPEVMGSRSTNLKCELGGFRGRALVVGDYLPFATKSIDFLPNLGSHRIDGDNAFYGFEEDEVTVRVIPGPQEHMFTDAGIQTFYGRTYTTTTKSDRMGYRLDGPEIETKRGSDIISDGIAFGAVQVPSHGRPIIMLADRQTTGGYAKIGSIATVDIPKLVQRPPGSTVRFERISVQDAQALLREEARRFDMLALKVRRPSADGISPRRTARRLTPILEKQAERTQADTLWIDRANRAERVGNRNLLTGTPIATDKQPTAKGSAPAASAPAGPREEGAPVEERSTPNAASAHEDGNNTA